VRRNVESFRNANHLLSIASTVSSYSVNMSQDRTVQETNEDAAKSKYACMKAGYYQDEFLDMFVTNPVKRNPIINMGHYVRVMVLRRIIDEFISTFDSRCQIVSLGAGSDTSCLRALTKNVNLIAFEIDFPPLIFKKCRVLNHQDNRLGFLETGEVHQTIAGDIFCHFPRLKLIGHDLRHPTPSLSAKLTHAGFDKSVPTLFISECVFIYLDKQNANEMLRWIAHEGAEPATARMIAVYEQINNTDAFGRVMVENLALRGCPLQSIESNLDDLGARFVKSSFSHHRVELMSHFDPLIPRIRPEIIDEYEEYNLLQHHYALSLAWSDHDKLTAMANTIFDRDDNSLS
jgi:O-methyltransferase involved in polyketide biosynthesis